MARTPRGAPGRPSPRARWVFWLAVVEAAITVATAILVTVGGPSNAVSCPSFPSCLGSQATLVAFVHQAAAGLLLLLAVAIAVLAFPLRSARPRVFSPALVGLVALVVTATFGMLFASGVLSTYFAPIQYVFLTAVVVLYVLTAYGASQARSAVSTGRGGARST